MCAATRAVKVTILGREYAFASQGEDADAHVRRVAELVDERMRETSRRASRQGPLAVAVLTGLELVDELLSLQREADSVEEQIAERASRLSSSLGQLLGDLDDETTADEDAQAQQEESAEERSTGRRFDLPGSTTDRPRFDTAQTPVTLEGEATGPPTGEEPA